jgi:hypothetical protein
MRIIEIKNIEKIIAYNNSKPVSPFQQISMWQSGDVVVCDYKQAIEFSNIQDKDLLKTWPYYWIKDYGNGVIEKIIVPSGTNEEIEIWLQNPKHEKKGIILASKKDQLLGLPEVWQESDWHFETDEKTGQEWAYITSFNHYWTPEIEAQFDHVYDNEQDFQNWKETGIIKYTELEIEL